MGSDSRSCPRKVASPPVTVNFSFPASTGRFYQLVYSTNLFASSITSNLGWGVPGMVVTNESLGEWFGEIRVLLQEP